MRGWGLGQGGQHWAHVTSEAGAWPAQPPQPACSSGCVMLLHNIIIRTGNTR